MGQNDEKEKFSRAKLIWRFARKYKLSFIALYICLVVETILNMLTPIIIGLLIDEVIYYKNIDFFWRITLIYIICMTCVTLLYSIHPNIWRYLMTKFVFDIRLELFERIITAQASFLSNAKTGDLIARINGDTNELMHIIQRNVFHFFNGIVQLVLALVFVLLYSWKAAILMAIIIPISVFISKHYGGKARKQSAAARMAYGNYISWVYEIIKGLREIRLMAAEKRSTVHFIGHYKKMTMIKIRASFIQLKATQLIGLVKLSSNMSLYVLAGILSFHGEITLGAFIAMLDYFTRANDMLSYLVNNNIDMQLRKAAIDRVYELLTVSTEIDNSPKEKLNISNGVIEFSHVSFQYDNRQPVLKDINFRIESGERVSIVGASGAGKTTLAYLILKFYKPDYGTVVIDETDINRCSQESLRKSIGMVQQENLIFNGTIRMNLALGNRHSTDTQMLEACDKAAIGDFVRQIPDGLDTMIGKDGLELSGGQRQRLAIARIYLKNPKILIFDEATSALDYESEKAVHQAWEELSKGRTTITIAHRLTTVLQSDRVAVLQEGKIVSFASHLELLETCPHYQNLFKEQYIGQEAELAC